MLRRARLKVISLFQRQLISRHKSINRGFEKLSTSTGQVEALLLLSSIPERIAVWKRIELPTATIRERKHTQGVLSHNCYVSKTSRKTINNQNCKKYMAPRNNGRQKLPNSRLRLTATSYAAAQNCEHTQKYAKKSDGRKKKIRRIQILAGRNQIKTHEPNSKNRANIKINRRKDGYVHFIDLHTQMSKGEGRRGWRGGSSRDAELRQLEKQNGTEIRARRIAPRSALWRKFLVVFYFGG